MVQLLFNARVFRMRVRLHRSLSYRNHKQPKALLVLLIPILFFLLGYINLYWKILSSSSSDIADQESSLPALTSRKMTASLVVVAPTFYTSLEEIRYLLGVQACQNAAKYGIRLILVDASPNDEIRQGLERAGQDPKDPSKAFVKVVRQKAQGRKGAALREAIQLAYDEATELASGDRVVVIGFQELEKVDMFRHWMPLVQHMVENSADVTAFRRSDSSFRSTYPIEQYHCETFANMYLDSLGAEIGLTSIDWTSGPLAFRHTLVNHWINFDGELWDAQLVPLVKAHLAGAKVTSFETDYQHPKSMKEQEEGVAAWNEKRLLQLNFLRDTVGKLMTESASAKSKS